MTFCRELTLATGHISAFSRVPLAIAICFIAHAGEFRLICVKPRLATACSGSRGLPQTRATLLIAKLDRLARNVSFISNLLEAFRGNGKNVVKFVACDLPEANSLTIHIMAAFVE